ncbi:MAG TPA: SRPBCC domain-containing protein [Thermomicrobiales bacterium]|nr:SRPBCC domain-containing protein [Thermomicrobiales bacterium]
MTVTSVEKDYDNLQLVLTAEFSASIEQVWELWADPRKLERWWGPPTYPATFVEHDLTPGAIATYYMTSPEGEKHYGWWQITAVSPPTTIVFNDGFGDQDGNPAEGMPVGETRLELAETATGTRMTLIGQNSTLEQFNMVLEMGMEEGITASVGQMDAILAEGA